MAQKKLRMYSQTINKFRLESRGGIRHGGRRSLGKTCSFQLRVKSEKRKNKDDKFIRYLPGSVWHPGQDVLVWVAMDKWELTGMTNRDSMLNTK